MSAIVIPNVNPDSSQPRLAAVLADVLDMTPLDARLVYSFAVVSAPGGSSATFSGAAIQPDVVGEWVFSVTAGSDVLRVQAFVFATSVYASVATDPTGRTRSDAERRQILKGVCNAVALSALVAWNSGTFPPGLDARFLQFGGT